MFKIFQKLILLFAFDQRSSNARFGKDGSFIFQKTKTISSIIYLQISDFLSVCVGFAGRHVAAVGPVFDSAVSVVVKNVPEEAVCRFENVVIRARDFHMRLTGVLVRENEARLALDSALEFEF